MEHLPCRPKYAKLYCVCMKHNLQDWKRSVCRSNAPGRQGRGSRERSSTPRPSPRLPWTRDCGLWSVVGGPWTVDCGPAGVAQVYPLKWPYERESAEKRGKARKKINKNGPAVRQTKRTPPPLHRIMSSDQQLSANMNSRAPATDCWIQNCLPRRSLGVGGWTACRAVAQRRRAGPQVQRRKP